MRLSAVVQAAGATFTLLGPRDTQLASTKPVVSVCAVRTGCGKSQTARRVIEVLMGRGLKVVAVRHPMPYGDLAAQKVQRFATLEDLEKAPLHHRGDGGIRAARRAGQRHLRRGGLRGHPAGRRADPGGCDVIVWDGGNNDFPFFRPDLAITVVDPHRPGPRDRLLPRRGQPAHRRRGGDQQDGQRPGGRSGHGPGQHRRGEPGGGGGRRPTRRSASTTPPSSPASGCWWWRTGPP